MGVKEVNFVAVLYIKLRFFVNFRIFVYSKLFSTPKTTKLLFEGDGIKYLPSAWGKSLFDEWGTGGHPPQMDKYDCSFQLCLRSGET